jgi:hypothetical protein
MRELYEVPIAATLEGQVATKLIGVNTGLLPGVVQLNVSVAPAPVLHDVIVPASASISQQPAAGQLLLTLQLPRPAIEPISEPQYALHNERHLTSSCAFMQPHTGAWSGVPLH